MEKKPIHTWIIVLCFHYGGSANEKKKFLKFVRLFYFINIIRSTVTVQLQWGMSIIFGNLSANCRWVAATFTDTTLVTFVVLNRWWWWRSRWGRFANQAGVWTARVTRVADGFIIANLLLWRTVADGFAKVWIVSPWSRTGIVKVRHCVCECVYFFIKLTR